MDVEVLSIASSCAWTWETVPVLIWLGWGVYPLLGFLGGGLMALTCIALHVDSCTVSDDAVLGVVSTAERLSFLLSVFSFLLSFPFFSLLFLFSVH